MEHPTDRELEGYARGAAKAWVAPHVGLCAVCQGKVRALLPEMAWTLTEAVMAARR